MSSAKRSAKRARARALGTHPVQVEWDGDTYTVQMRQLTWGEAKAMEGQSSIELIETLVASVDGYADMEDAPLDVLRMALTVDQERRDADS